MKGTVALMLETGGPGGAERLLLDLAEELRSRGWEVVPVGPAAGNPWLATQFRDRGFVTETFRLRGPIDWRCARDLAATLRRRQVDVVHSHEFTMAVYGTVAAAMIGRPHVITFHGSQTMTRAWRRRVAVRMALGRAIGVAVSAATRAQLATDLGIPAARLHVVINGVPIREGRPDAVRAELGIAPDDVVILAVGNLDPRKGHRRLLEALVSLRDAGLAVPWRLVIAGGRGGPELGPLESLAREREVAGRVHILQHRNDIPDLLAAAHVFAMPSLWEGLPLALLEAMLAGKPVVASRTSGIPEAVDDGVEGLLVPPGDVPALATALRAVLEDPARRQRMARAARARGLRDFTVARMATDYEALYRAARPGPAA